MSSIHQSLTLIAAVTKTNGIGQSSVGIPWHLPKDLAFFSRATSIAPAGKTNAVVMGRKCWESIPLKHRPLKGRINVVVSSQSDYNLGGGNSNILASSPREGLSALSKLDYDDEEASSTDPETVRLHRTFIIGGAQIYRESLSYPETNRILITRIFEPDFDCDVYFPEFRSGSDRDSGDNGPAGPSPEDPGSESGWKRLDHEALVDWVGFDVPRGIQEDKGIKYEFQMWVRGSQ